MINQLDLSGKELTKFSNLLRTVLPDLLPRKPDQTDIETASASLRSRSTFPRFIATLISVAGEQRKHLVQEELGTRRLFLNDI